MCVNELSYNKKINRILSCIISKAGASRWISFIKVNLKHNRQNKFSTHLEYEVSNDGTFLMCKNCDFLQALHILHNDKFPF